MAGQLMDEMSRFEAEISGSTNRMPPRPYAPPPLQPPPFIPHQLQAPFLHHPQHQQQQQQRMWGMPPGMVRVGIPMQIPAGPPPTIQQAAAPVAVPIVDQVPQSAGGPEEGSTPTPAVIMAAPKRYGPVKPAPVAKKEEEKKKHGQDKDGAPSTSGFTPPGAGSTAGAGLPDQVQQAKQAASDKGFYSVYQYNPDSQQPQVPGQQPQQPKKKQKKVMRTAGGQVWEDPTLTEWDPDDFRVFCGDLGNDVGDDLLTRTFSKYPSFVKAKVVKDKRTNKSKGYGFVSFRDPKDYVKAVREMNGKYVGSRPIKLRKSAWKERNLDSVRKKKAERAAMGYKV